MSMTEQDKRMIEMLQQMQSDIEKSVKDALTRKGIPFDADVEILNWENEARGLIESGPCASQDGCDDRCKGNYQECATRFFCEAYHVCGYRCRIVNDPCANRTCYSQPSG